MDTQTDQTRRLAAIMFTDIVGYSALMGQSEDKAFALLRQNREIHKRCISQNNGQFIKEMGDGILASFPTVTDAVECALRINKEVAALPGLEIRTGIHSGEIIEEGNDVFGDGVNIASRVSDQAKSGEIWVTEAVFGNIKNKNYEARAAGSKRLKNIDQPVKLYVVGGSNVVRPKKSLKGVAYLLGAAILILLVYFIYTRYPQSVASQEKSIAVIPFRNMSDLSENQYFADGVSGAIHSHLTKIEDIKVVSAQSSFQFRASSLSSQDIADELQVNYLLLGSAQREADQVQIRIELVEASSDKTMWNEVYTRKYENVFEIQTEIAEGILKKLKASFTSDEKERLEEVPTLSTSAYDLYLLGLFQSKKVFDPVESQKGIEYFKRSIQIDPTFAQAYAAMGDLYSMFAYFEEENSALYVDSAQQVVDKALELSPDLPEALNVKAYLLRTFEWKWEEARSLFVQALKRDPNNSLILRNYSLLLLVLNERDSAVNTAQKAFALDPLSPVIRENMGRIWSFTGHFDEAEVLMDEEVNFFGKLQFKFQQGDTLGAAAFALASMAEQGVPDTTINRLQSLVDSGLIDQFWIESTGGNEFGYLTVGDYEKALDLMEVAVQARDGYVIYIGCDPVFDPLRSNPRFHALMDTLGLTPYY